MAVFECENRISRYHPGHRMAHAYYGPFFAAVNQPTPVRGPYPKGVNEKMTLFSTILITKNLDRI